MDTKRLQIGTIRLQIDIVAIEPLVVIVFDLLPSAESNHNPTKLVRFGRGTILSPSEIQR